MKASRELAIAALMLAVLATSGCTSGDGSVGSPSASADPQQTAAPVRAVVRSEDFQIKYRLDGITQDSAAVGLYANPQLQLVPSVANGGRVSKGESIGTLRVDPRVRAELSTAARTSRIERDRLAALETSEGDATAPVSGIFSTRKGSISAPGIDVVVDLTPIQALRYSSLTFTGRASVETVTGQREVRCDAVWTQYVGGGQKSLPDDDPNSATPSSRLHCRLPTYVETAAGLTAVVSLESAPLRGATVVPNFYVGYDAHTDGYVVTLEGDSAPKTVPVRVGVTDGVVRVITSALPVGAALVLPAGDGK